MAGFLGLQGEDLPEEDQAGRGIPSYGRVHEYYSGDEIPKGFEGDWGGRRDRGDSSFSASLPSA